MQVTTSRLQAEMVMQVTTSSLLQNQPLITHLRIKCLDPQKWEIPAQTIRPSPLATPQPPHPPKRHLKQPLAVAATDAAQLLLGDAECITQRRPRATGNSLPRSGRNLKATNKVQLLQGGVLQDFQQVCRPIGTFGVAVKAPGVLKRGLWG